MTLGKIGALSEAMQILADLLTAAAAFTGAGAGLWNAYRFGKLTARVDTPETAHNAQSTRRPCTTETA